MGSYAKHSVFYRQSELIKVSFASFSKLKLSSTWKNKETERAKIYNFPPTPDQRKCESKKKKCLEVKFKTSQNKPQ